MKTSALAARLIRLAGLSLAAAGLALWVVRGAHPGWTQTKVTTLEVDPITELEHPVTVDRFVPGVDFLGVTVGAGAALAALGLLLGRRRAA